MAAEDRRALPGVRWRRHLPRVVLESALIVFSILLALVLDEWRQDRRHAVRLDEARAAFAEEVRQNLTLVEDEDHLPRRRLLIRRYEELARLPEPTSAHVRSVWDDLGSGVRPTPFRDAAWRSLSGSEVLSRMPYDERFVLADIYRQQEEVNRWHDRMFDVWSQIRADRDSPALIRDDVERTRSYLSDVIAGEERLVVMYRRALDRLGSPPSR